MYRFTHTKYVQKGSNHVLVTKVYKPKPQFYQIVMIYEQHIYYIYSLNLSIFVIYLFICLCVHKVPFTYAAKDSPPPLV